MECECVSVRVSVHVCDLFFCVCIPASKGSHVNRLFGWSSKAPGFGWRIETPLYLAVPACLSPSSLVCPCLYQRPSFCWWDSFPLLWTNLFYSITSAFWTPLCFADCGLSWINTIQENDIAPHLYSCWMAFLLQRSIFECAFEMFIKRTALHACTHVLRHWSVWLSRLLHWGESLNASIILRVVVLFSFHLSSFPLIKHALPASLSIRLFPPLSMQCSTWRGFSCVTDLRY